MKMKGYYIYVTDTIIQNQQTQRICHAFVFHVRIFFLFFLLCKKKEKSQSKKKPTLQTDVQDGCLGNPEPWIVFKQIINFEIHTVFLDFFVFGNFFLYSQFVIFFFAKIFFGKLSIFFLSLSSLFLTFFWVCVTMLFETNTTKKQLIKQKTKRKIAIKKNISGYSRWDVTKMKAYHFFSTDVMNNPKSNTKGLAMLLTLT